MIKSILSGLPALQKGAQEQVVLNKYLFEAFYTYVDFLYLPIWLFLAAPIQVSALTRV